MKIVKCSKVLKVETERGWRKACEKPESSGGVGDKMPTATKI